VWILAGVIVATVVLIVKAGSAPGPSDQAFIYVVVGGVAGFLLHRVYRRRRGAR
jgi:hypothetical protein